MTGEDLIPVLHADEQLDQYDTGIFFESLESSAKDSFIGNLAWSFLIETGHIKLLVSVTQIYLTSSTVASTSNWPYQVHRA